MNQIGKIMELVVMENAITSKRHRQIIKLKIKKLHKGLYLLTCRLTSKEIKKVADLALHVWVCLRECVKGCNPNTPLYIMLKYHIKISSMNSK
jgi:hypothetical protein